MITTTGGQGAQPIAQAALDSIVNAFGVEVGRYEDNVRRLVSTLEVPQPKNEPCEGKTAMSQTVQDAFNHMFDRMSNINDYLNGIINRLQEQVGELKILP
jgi:hypothetical protein